jgi:phosphomevalonate kinase
LNLRASAPGKMILLGEYAVLFGAPALVMAVDRRATVEISAIETPGIEIHAPDVCPSIIRLNVDRNGQLSWLEGAEHAELFALVTGILRGLATAGIFDPPAAGGLRLTLDTSAFFHRDSSGETAKLGLGSSAALTVALAGALAIWSGREVLVADRPHWLARLLVLHREFQGGNGSGIDLAASFYGGSLRFVTAASGTDAMPSAVPFVWPQSLLRLPVWSGQSASTSSFLKQLYRWQTESPEIAKAQLGALCALASKAADAAESGQPQTLRRYFDAYAQALHALGEAAKINIFTAEHLEISRHASRFGLSYKPSGAGGGDLGLVVAEDADILAAFRQALFPTPYAALDLGPDNRGFCIER